MARAPLPRPGRRRCALALLSVFAGFCAWAAWTLVDESLMFDAHDNSALRIPLAVPQGVWCVGLLAFSLVMPVTIARAVFRAGSRPASAPHHPGAPR